MTSILGIIMICAGGVLLGIAVGFVLSAWILDAAPFTFSARPLPPPPPPPIEKTILVCRKCGKPSKRKIGKNTMRRCNYCHGRMAAPTQEATAPAT